MDHGKRAHALLLRILFLMALAALAACSAPTSATLAPTSEALPTIDATATAVPSPVPTPTSVPTVTPEPRLAEGVYIAGIEVGGLTPTEARQDLATRLAPLLQPLDIRAGDREILLRPEEIGMRIDVDAMLDAARAAPTGERVPLQIEYDEDKLRAALAALNEEVSVPAQFSVITETKTISRSFVMEGGLSIDIESAIQQIDDRLRSVGAPRRVTLTLAPQRGPAARPDPQMLQDQLEAMTDSWRGVIGIYVYDLTNNEVVAAVNPDTAFAAASTIKMPIMLNAYINLPDFTEKQQAALRTMIVESDNLAANALLAASVGGVGTEDAIVGAERMSAMLANLGFPETFQYVPFEAQDYIKLMKLKVRAGPARGGKPPYTEAGRYLRTTPREMATLYVEVDRCARGEGLLLERFDDMLTPERCQEMLDNLAQNGDNRRLVAGLPEGVRVEHKSGWIDDMQADVGIVRSPGGDYVVAIYVYRPIASGDAPVPDRIMMSTIAAFSRLVYTYFNPLIAS